jgi:rSAM-associated Gly-rich repeat protein
MSDLSRRQLLAGVLGGLAQAAGTVVLARSVLAEATAEEASTPAPGQASLLQRADRVAAEQGPPDEDDDLQPSSFVNGGFANGGGGGFRKGGFANGGGAGFRNGGFANGGGGGFRNGAFRN